jgi:hypothetical protein
MGCMKKLGCLVVIILVAVACFVAYKTGWLRFGKPSPTTAAGAASTWQPLSDSGAKRAKLALDRLSARNGPVYANVAPGDLAAYIFQELSHTLPSSADSIEAGAFGDRLYVRAIVKTKDLGGSGALGPLSALLGDRERVQLGGTLRIIRPGLAELQVKEIKIREITLPQALIPRLISQISKDRPAGMSADALPLKTPEYIGDLRVSDGKITLYKTAAR